MKHLKRIDEFDSEDDFLTQDDRIQGRIEAKITRYLLHISPIKHRESIRTKGLTPKLPGRKWKMLHGDDFIKAQYWTKPAVFATLFKDSIDVYDVKNVHNHTFPLWGLVDGAPLDFDEFIESRGLEFKRAKYTGRHADMAAQEDFESWLELANQKYNEYAMKNSKFDIWLIDTEEMLGAKWFEDVGHGQFNNVMCYDPIPPRALDLLAPANRPMVKNF